MTSKNGRRLWNTHEAESECAGMIKGTTQKKKGDQGFDGPRCCRRGILPPCLFLKMARCLCSIAKGSSSQSASWKRKYLTRMKMRSLLCASSLDLTDFLLLPMYTISSLASPNSYAPALSGAEFIFSKVKGRHTCFIGAEPLQLKNQDELAPPVVFPYRKLWMSIRATKRKSVAPMNSPSNSSLICTTSILGRNAPTRQLIDKGVAVPIHQPLVIGTVSMEGRRC